jgi:hypothetical protein
MPILIAFILWGLGLLAAWAIGDWVAGWLDD